VKEIVPGQLRRIDYRVLTRDPDTESILLVLFPDSERKGRTLVILDGQMKSFTDDFIRDITHPLT